ncbi:MAG: hypothetical protein ACI30R_05915 [Sodaliphilus sp.]
MWYSAPKVQNATIVHKAPPLSPPSGAGPMDGSGARIPTVGIALCHSHRR